MARKLDDADSRLDPEDTSFVGSKAAFIPFTNKNNIGDYYTFEGQIGIGGFSTVLMATHLSTGERRAVKVVDKVKLKGKIAQLDLEFRILMELDHPNIIKIFEIFETNELIFIVQEMCHGGELCDALAHNSKLQTTFTEEDASKIFRQLASSLIYLHSFNIRHGDVKPDNILLKYPNDLSCLKLIDFGFSKKLGAGEYETKPLGTCMYLAPEFIVQKADTRSDNWAMGVILYLMLSGKFPFRGESDKAKLKAIMHGAFTFDDPAFYGASFEVKDLISKLLTRNPNDRYTAYQAYHHPWVQRLIDAEDSHVVISADVLQNLQNYKRLGDFEKTVCYMVALKLEDKDITKFKEIFVKVDKDGDGMVNCAEFSLLFSEFQTYKNLHLTPKQVARLFEAIDVNRNKMIDYSEFIASFVMNKIKDYEVYLQEVFTAFDVNADGLISKAEIEDFFKKHPTLIVASDLAKIVEQIDSDKSGFISRAELLDYVKSTVGDKLTAKLHDLEAAC